MERETCIAELIQEEWAMFDAVKGIYGRATCQDDWYAFRIMRESQFNTWGDALLLLYKKHIATAKEQDMNLMSIKYAFMMEDTDFERFQLFAHELPPISAEMQENIESILRVNLAWEEEMDRRYPFVRAKGRPRTKQENNRMQTSFETYLRGELKSYSAEMLDLYAENVVQYQNDGRNLALENLENMVRSYGYESLDAAEESLALSRQNRK